jgi:hypothetical protein
MGLFKAFKNTLSATVRTAILPLDIAKDAVTLGGVSTRDGKSAVVKRGKQIAQELEEALAEITR